MIFADTLEILLNNKGEKRKTSLDEFRDTVIDDELKIGSLYDPLASVVEHIGGDWLISRSVNLVLGPGRDAAKGLSEKIAEADIRLKKRYHGKFHDMTVNFGGVLTPGNQIKRLRTGPRLDLGKTKERAGSSDPEESAKAGAYEFKSGDDVGMYRMMKLDFSKFDPTLYSRAVPPQENPLYKSYSEAIHSNADPYKRTAELAKLWLLSKLKEAGYADLIKAIEDNKQHWLMPKFNAYLRFIVERFIEIFNPGGEGNALALPNSDLEASPKARASAARLRQQFKKIEPDKAGLLKINFGKLVLSNRAPYDFVKPNAAQIAAGLGDADGNMIMNVNTWPLVRGGVVVNAPLEDIRAQIGIKQEGTGPGAILTYDKKTAPIKPAEYFVRYVWPQLRDQVLNLGDPKIAANFRSLNKTMRTALFRELAEVLFNQFIEAVDPGKVMRNELIGEGTVIKGAVDYGDGKTYKETIAKISAEGGSDKLGKIFVIPELSILDQALAKDISGILESAGYPKSIKAVAEFTLQDFEKAVGVKGQPVQRFNSIKEGFGKQSKALAKLGEAITAFEALQTAGQLSKEDEAKLKKVKEAYDRQLAILQAGVPKVMANSIWLGKAREAKVLEGIKEADLEAAVRVLLVEARSPHKWLAPDVPFSDDLRKRYDWAVGLLEKFRITAGSDLAKVLKEVLKLPEFAFYDPKAKAGKSEAKTTPAGRGQFLRDTKVEGVGKIGDVDPMLYFAAFRDQIADVASYAPGAPGLGRGVNNLKEDQVREKAARGEALSAAENDYWQVLQALETEVAPNQFVINRTPAALAKVLEIALVKRKYSQDGNTVTDYGIPEAALKVFMQKLTPIYGEDLLADALGIVLRKKMLDNRASLAPRMPRRGLLNVEADYTGLLNDLNAKAAGNFWRMTPNPIAEATTLRTQYAAIEAHMNAAAIVDLSTEITKVKQDMAYMQLLIPIDPASPFRARAGWPTAEAFILDVQNRQDALTRIQGLRASIQPILNALPR